MSTTNFMGAKPGIPERLRRLANAPYKDPDALRWIADTLESTFADIKHQVNQVDGNQPRTPEMEVLIDLVTKGLR